MKWLRHISDEAFALAGSMYFHMAAGMVANLLMARMLEPGEFGIIGQIYTGATFFSLLSLGIGQAAMLKVPVLLSQDREEEIAQVISLTILIGIGVPLASAAAYVAYKLGFCLTRPGDGYIYAVFLAYVLLNQIQLVLINTYIRGWKRFSLQSRGIVLNAAAGYAFLIFFAWLWGIRGALAGLIVQPLVFDLLVVRGVRLLPLRRCPAPLAKECLAAGLPLAASSAAGTLFFMADRLAITGALAPEAGRLLMGFHGIAVKLAEAAQRMTFVVFSVVMVRMQEARAGSEKPEADVLEILHRTSRPLAAWTPAATGLAVGCYQVMIAVFLAPYLPALTAMRHLSWAGVFVMMNIFPVMALMNRGRLWTQSLLSALPMAAALGADFLLLKAGFGLAELCLVTLVCSALLVLLMHAFAYRSLGDGSWLAEAARLYGPFLAAMAADYAGAALLGFFSFLPLHLPLVVASGLAAAWILNKEGLLAGIAFAKGRLRPRSRAEA